jgi:hypothetical protein
LRTDQPVAFGNLSTSDLHIDTVYLGGTAGTAADDALARLLPVGNQGGFRGPTALHGMGPAETVGAIPQASTCWAHAPDRIGVDFALEAKCYQEHNAVGVREVSWLISRLNHRDFGVFVTRSYFNPQAYQEIREDSHPVVLICGRDIVDTLRRHRYTDQVAVQAWLANQLPVIDDSAT